MAGQPPQHEQLAQRGLELIHLPAGLGRVVVVDVEVPQKLQAHLAIVPRKARDEDVPAVAHLGQCLLTANSGRPLDAFVPCLEREHVRHRPQEAHVPAPGSDEGLETGLHITLLQIPQARRQVAAHAPSALQDLSLAGHELLSSGVGIQDFLQQRVPAVEQPVVLL